MKLLIIATALIFVTMCGIAIAEGGYGMMDSNCTNCTDVPCCQAEASSADIITVSDSTASTSYASTTSVLEKWTYGRRNECPDGIEHVCWDFEEGSNLGVFKNAHPVIML